MNMRMDGWTIGWMDRGNDEWTCRRLDGCAGRRKDEWMHGNIEGLR